MLNITLMILLVYKLLAHNEIQSKQTNFNARYPNIGTEKVSCNSLINKVDNLSHVLDYWAKNLFLLT